VQLEKFVVHIIKFNVQCSKFKVKIRSPNLFYISGPEKVRNRVENQLFCYLCKCFIIN